MNPKTSQDLFNKIRSQFSNIKIGDENGGATANPENAVFFEFEYQPDSDTFGSVSVSIADGENMKVYYNRDLVNKIDEDDRNEWYAFLKELKDFAVEHSLTFDVRDITKSNLTKQDYQNIADTSKTVNTDEMSEELARITKLAGVTEGLTGTAKRSYENLDKTRLIIRHSGKVDETVPGARSRQIQSLYIENEDGERFKYPLTHLAGARAMTRHVANGGRPHDEFGEHIIRTSEDIAKLNSFSRYVSNKDQLNDNAGDIIAQTKLKLENLREYMRNLSKQSHYENASKDFKTSEEQILDDETVAKLKEKFTMTNLDKRVEDAFPLINKVMAELENMPKDEEQVNELEPDAEPIDAPIEPPMDHGGVVTSFLTDPKKKLVLRKDDSADKMLQVTKFKNKNTMLSSILSDIASRMLSKSGEEDRVANFASRVADGLDQENSATFKPDADYIKNKKIAIQLAKRYIDDFKKMQADPKFADEIRMEPGAYNPKKDLKGKAKETEAFEGWVDSVGEATIKPYVSMYKDDKDGKMIYDVLDKDSNSAFKSKDYDAATEYLRQNYDKLREVEHQPKDKELEKKDKENAMKLDVTKADKMMNTTAFKRMQAGDERYADKTEGNEFANAVRKAKAAGMKAGDKFKVGDQEYTLKDAIEIAGLQLEEFFSEEGDEAEAQPSVDAQAEAEEINTELDRIKTLANLS